MSPLQALKHYFGYDSFRPLQAEIIHSVLNRRDTLALLPTGGGKSLCFQIPTLVQEGLCLVITPLIALMKDQVENLRKRDILAAAIYTGMSFQKQCTALDNCQYGPYRFLYVSPERLESEDFRRRLVQLPICLIAVDEAHCISQWGYDFRPSYLQIAAIREYLPSVPVLALTATATPQVANDIQERLLFAEKHVFQSSFHRDNLHYVVRMTDNKDEQLLHILSRVEGSAIVYVRNRKRSQELSEWLQSNQQHAEFYHAGLAYEVRNQKQEQWKKGETRVMVCTNAFGMGIDKADVRLVIHYDLPDTLEAYYQEAGRAGRDGQLAYAVLLYNREDRTKAKKRIADHYPEKEFIYQVYHKTCDFFQIGLGSGLGHVFALHMDQLCQVMHLPLLPTYSALHILSWAGYIDFQEEQETSPRVRINVSADLLEHYALSAEQKQLLDHLMRQYAGIFTDLQYIHDEDHSLLASLSERHIITYLPRTVACQLTMVQERQDTLFLSHRIYEERLDLYTKKLAAMVNYAEQDDDCRENVLLSYFGETDAPACTHCDVCLTHLRHS